MTWVLRADHLSKTFRLHAQGGARLAVLKDFSLELHPGEALALVGPSGSGKSTVLRLLYGNYRLQRGSVEVLHRGSRVRLDPLVPSEILDLRRWTLAQVSQFLRVIPRVPARDVVMEPLLQRGVDPVQARRRAESMLDRLGIPERLWSLSPTTFSGGEQQRVNLARAFVAPYSVFLLDEPTASLDSVNRDRVIALILEARQRGSAILGIFHDPETLVRIGARTLAMDPGAGSICPAS